MNDKYPGRPDYTGPTQGYFALLHHDKLFEHSHDVMERVTYVKRGKPAHEIVTRLHNMIYLPFMDDALDADYEAKRDALDADYQAKLAPLDADYEAKRDALYADYQAKRDALYADYQAKCDALYADYRAKRDTLGADYRAKCAPLYADILAYVRTNIPDCAWNGHELVFPK